MLVAIYNISNGQILRRTDCSPSQVASQCFDGEEFYLNPPPEATHIVDGEPVAREVQLPVELLLFHIRLKRSSLLSACDWTQLPDAPVEKREDWARYRQELRDFPETCDPINPVWPTPPS